MPKYTLMMRMQMQVRCRRRRRHHHHCMTCHASHPFAECDKFRFLRRRYALVCDV
jgi:hypothetical protein